MTRQETTFMLSRWAVEIIGHALDVRNLTSKVNGCIQGPEDLFVSNIGTSACLRCSAWDDVPDAQQLSAIAERELAVLRGCLDSLDGCGRLGIGTIFELDKGGAVRRTRTNQTNIVILPAEADRSSPVMMRAMLDAARNSDGLRIAAAEMAAFADWHSIYKTIEACLDALGGIRKYKESDPKGGVLLDRKKQTANWYRHASVTHAFPKNPVPIEDARAFARKLVKYTAGCLRQGTAVAADGLSYKVPANPFPDRCMALPNYRYGGALGYEVGVAGQAFHLSLMTDA